MLFFPRFKYPKLAILILTYILAYVIFTDRNSLFFKEILVSTGYLGVFICGILYTYGFTSGPATALLLILSKNVNILLAGLLAGVGSLLGDMLIFEFIRSSFADELEKLSHEKLILRFEKHLPRQVLKHGLPVLAAFIIASPLPDEIGVALFAASKISIKNFTLLDYFFNTTGILLILLIGVSI
jgi:hypothetical protein